MKHLTHIMLKILFEPKSCKSIVTTSWKIDVTGSFGPSRSSYPGNACGITTITNGSDIVHQARFGTHMLSIIGL